MKVPLIYFCFIGIQFVAKYMSASELTNHGYLQTSDMGWWEARQSCMENGTDLFVPSQTINYSTQVQLDTYYWVGAFETSQWRWTDDTPLFTPMGQYDIPNDVDAHFHNINGNSVLECYRACDENIIGLSGPKCYCLGEDLDLQASSGENVNIESCPGNQEEACGTHSSISVYKMDINFDVGENGDYQCAYMDKDRSGGYVVKPGDCQRYLYGVCVDDDDVEPDCHDGSVRPFLRCVKDLCVTCWHAPWSSSHQSCSLVNVSSSHASNLTAFIKENFDYWIGLHKHIARKWVSGEEIEHNYPISTNMIDPGPRCLALYVSSTGWSADWIPCNIQLPSLCTTGQKTTENVVNILTEPTVATTEAPAPTLSTPAETTVDTIVGVTTDKVGNKSAAGRVDGDEMMPERNDPSIGIIVGAVIGVFFVVALILVIIIILKRRNHKKRNAQPEVVYTVPDREINDQQYESFHVYESTDI